MISTQEEYLLINRILAGEEFLYATLVDKYKSYAYTLALKIVETKSEAEEIAQDGFIKAFRYLDKFNKEAKFSTWLYRIVFNTAISYKRKNRQPFHSLQNTLVSNSGGAESGLEKEDKQIFIAQALKSLPETDRLAVQLYYLNEFSLEETAEIMGQNMNTLKVRIHRARQKLGDELKRILQEEALTL